VALAAINASLQSCPNAPPGHQVVVDFYGPNNTARLKCDHATPHCWEPPQFGMGSCSP
jgi:hypothetical protein